MPIILLSDGSYAETLQAYSNRLTTGGAYIYDTAPVATNPTGAGLGGGSGGVALTIALSVDGAGLGGGSGGAALSIDVGTAGEGLGGGSGGLALSVTIEPTGAGLGGGSGGAALTISVAAAVVRITQTVNL